jgi:hypothetical protein
MYKIENLWARLNNLVPDPLCSTREDDYDTIIWNDERPMPSKEELEALDINSIIDNAEQLYEQKHIDANDKISEIASMSYSQLNTYLDNNNITNSALRKLFQVVLAILKKNDWSE